MLALASTGYGEQTYVNGNKYEGEWAEGLREGRGVMWIKGKDGKLRKVYSGNWKKDVKDVRRALLLCIAVGCVASLCTRRYPWLGYSCYMDVCPHSCGSLRTQLRVSVVHMAPS